MQVVCKEMYKMRFGVKKNQIFQEKSHLKNNLTFFYSHKKTLWKINKSSRHAGYVQTKVYNFIKFLRKKEKNIEGKSQTF